MTAPHSGHTAYTIVYDPSGAFKKGAGFSRLEIEIMLEMQKPGELILAENTFFMVNNKLFVLRYIKGQKGWMRKTTEEELEEHISQATNGNGHRGRNPNGRGYHAARRVG